MYPKQKTGPSTGSGNVETRGGVPASPDFPRIEEGVLAFWKGDDTFRASVARNPTGTDGANEFVFYDGRPSPTACRTTATC